MRIRRFRINRECSSCEDCVAPCPTGSIFLGEGRFVIDSDTCSGCGVCADICPESAVAKFELEVDDPPAVEALT